MNTLVINQTQVFLIFILSGGIIGILFDAFRILRKTFKTPDIVTYIEDIIFWLLTCIFLAYMILKYNNGELRLFIFIGLFIGIILYILLISKYVIKISVKILNILKRFLLRVLQVLRVPINAIIYILKKYLKPFLKTIKTIVKKMSKFAMKILEKISKNDISKKDFT